MSHESTTATGGQAYLFDLLEQLAAADVEPRASATVHADPVRGHIGILIDGEPKAFVITDDGDGHLDIWSGAGARLDVVAARDLGEALCAWAARRTGGEVVMS